MELTWYGTSKEIQHTGHFKLVPIKLLCTLSKYFHDAVISALAKAKHHIASKCLATSCCHDPAFVSDVLGIIVLEAAKRMYQIKMSGAENVLKLLWKQFFICLPGKQIILFVLGHAVPTVQDATGGAPTKCE